MTVVASANVQRTVQPSIVGPLLAILTSALNPPDHTANRRYVQLTFDAARAGATITVEARTVATTTDHPRPRTTRADTPVMTLPPLHAALPRAFGTGADY